MSKKITKTNAMRLLDKEKIPYEIKEYPSSVIAALDVAEFLNQSPEKLFKTLVTTDLEHGYYVFCLPAASELDLKKGAKILGIKKLEMLKQKELLPLTGYIHGGCSPVGMKKAFPTVIDKSALNHNEIFVSGGKIGLQIQINPKDLEQILDLKFDDICK